MKVSSLEAIATALHDAGVRYLVAGGLAVAAHGHGRVTFDLDLVLQLQPDNVRRAIAGLEGLGYRPTVPVPVPVQQFADVATREALIRMKEAAGRPKDLEDIRQLRLLQSDSSDER